MGTRPAEVVEPLESLELLGTCQWGLISSAPAQENRIFKVCLQRLNARGVLQRLRQVVYPRPIGPIPCRRAAQVDYLRSLVN